VRRSGRRWGKRCAMPDAGRLREISRKNISGREERCTARGFLRDAAGFSRGVQPAVSADAGGSGNQSSMPATGFQGPFRRIARRQRVGRSPVVGAVGSEVYARADEGADAHRGIGVLLSVFSVDRIPEHVHDKVRKDVYENEVIPDQPVLQFAR
jgi:hypothetical protein